jgi:hypothetical protein
MSNSETRRAFALRDLTTLTALAGLAAALFVPLAVQAGGQSRMSVCMSRLKSIGASTARYGLDFQDRLAALQGTPGRTVRYGNPGLGIQVTYSNNTAGDTQSVSNQAVDIIRRRSNRSDIQPIENFLASINFSHLAIVEHEQESLPSARWACPEDSTLLTWQSDPLNYNNLGVPAPGGPGALQNGDKRWPYISSYQRGGYTWSADRPSEATSSWNFTSASMYTSLGGFTRDVSNFGNRRLSQIRFPSTKVYLWDRGARHFTPTAVYWNFADTKQPMLFFDGGVINTRTTRTGSTLRGWDWQRPNNPNTTWSYRYQIESRNQEWQPGFPNGQPRGNATFSAAHFATTREGLSGTDLPIPGGQ